MNFRTENNPDGIFTGEIDEIEEIFRKEDGTISRSRILHHLDMVERACHEQKQDIERLRQDPDWESKIYKQVHELVSFDFQIFERFVTAGQRMTKMESQKEEMKEMNDKYLKLEQ